MSITSDKLADDCVNSAKMVYGTISTSDLSDDGFSLEEPTFGGTTRFACDILGRTPLRFEGSILDGVTLNHTLSDVSMSQSVLWPDLSGSFISFMLILFFFSTILLC